MAVCNVVLMHFCITDYDSNRLFWVDAKLHVIFASDFNGQNRQVVLTSYNNLMHPFSVAVFEVCIKRGIHVFVSVRYNQNELCFTLFLADCDFLLICTLPWL